MLIIIKITGCVLVMVSGTALGFLAAGELIRRAEDLNSFKSVAFLIQGEIRFNHTELPDILDNISQRHNSRLGIFFKNVSDELKLHNGKSFDEIWKQHMEQDIKLTSLNSEDKRLIREFGSNMGYKERDAQINVIDKFMNEIELKLGELRSVSGNKRKIYKALGFLGGLFTVIIFI